MTMQTCEKGDTVYIVVSNARVVECEVVSKDEDYIVVRFDGLDGPAAVRLLPHRIFSTCEEALDRMPRHR